MFSHPGIWVAFGIALAVAVAARRLRALSYDGAIMATLIGTAAMGSGWRWGVLLVAFFVASSALSRWRAATKEARTRGILEKGGERDAWQVAANGGVFAVAAILALRGWPAASALGAGALAAAAADTWATEIGTLSRRTPVSMLTLRPVPAGTSGGVTLLGWLGAALGAGFIAAVSAVLGWGPHVALAAVVGGLAGATADSLVGATVQARRWCARCAEATERKVHSCGERTTVAGGLRWMDNDTVNLLATIVGGVVALLTWRW